MDINLWICLNLLVDRHRDLGRLNSQDSDEGSRLYGQDVIIGEGLDFLESYMIEKGHRHLNFGRVSEFIDPRVSEQLKSEIKDLVKKNHESKNSI